MIIKVIEAQYKEAQKSGLPNKKLGGGINNSKAKQIKQNKNICLLFNYIKQKIQTKQDK